jgi:hypothetical protein
MSYATTHLAGVADRIDRSISPRGGREERELVDLSKKLWRRKQRSQAFIACAAAPSHFHAWIA